MKLATAFCTSVLTCLFQLIILTTLNVQTTTATPFTISGIKPNVTPIDFSRLEKNTDGSYKLELVGTGFVKSMSLKIEDERVPNSVKKVSVSSKDGRSVNIGFLQPVDAKLKFTLEKRESKNSVLISNSILVQFIKGEGGGDPGGDPNGNNGVFTGSTGDHLATVELAAPTVDTFVLNSSIPVPQGIGTRRDFEIGKSVLVVEDADGNLIPGQLTCVSQYSGANNVDCDVVNIKAKVKRKPGTRIQYRVLFQEYENPGWAHPVGKGAPQIFAEAPFSIPAEIFSILKSGKIILSAEDVFGHRYEADILAGPARVMSHGGSEVTLRTYNVMVSKDPQGPPTGALSNLLGIHAYITVDSSQAIKVSLRISNAHDSSTNETRYQKAVFFKSLNLEIAGNVAVRNAIADPFSGPQLSQGDKVIYPVIRDIGDGTMHYLKGARQIIRRYAVGAQNSSGLSYASHAVNEGGLAFPIDGQSQTNSSLRLFSYFNPKTNGYGPQRILAGVPNLSHLNLDSIRAKDLGDLNYHSGIIATGGCTINPYTGACTYPISIANPGPQYVWGVSYGGMTSGQEIDEFSGAMISAAASNSGYRFMQLQHSARHHRQEVLFQPNGEPASVDSLAKFGSCGTYTPVEYFGKFVWKQGLDPVGALTAPDYQYSYIMNNGLQPFYKGNIDNVDSEDGQHAIRFHRTATALYWLGFDPLAADDIRIRGEHALFEYTDRPQGCNGSQPKYAYQSLHSIRPDNEKLGCLGCGRSSAHAFLALVSAYAAGSDTYRARMKPTFEFIIDEIFARAQIPCLGKIVKLQNANCPSCFFSRGNEEALTVEAMIGMLNRVFEGVDPAHEQTTANVLSNEFYGIINVNSSWVSSWNSPRVIVPISSLGSPDQIWCNQSQWDAPTTATANSSGGYSEWLYGAPAAQILTGDNVFGAAVFSGTSGKYGGQNLEQSLENIQFKDLLPEHLQIMSCAQNGLC